VADLHIGHISQQVHGIKRARAIIELEELADVSVELPNSHALVHADDIDDENAIFHDQKAHPPLPRTLRKTTGIRDVGHAQFCWTTREGKEFFQDGVLRVRSSQSGGDFEVWDLDARRPNICQRCSNFHQEPKHHADGESCPKKQDVLKGQVHNGIKVLCTSLWLSPEPIRLAVFQVAARVPKDALAAGATPKAQLLHVWQLVLFRDFLRPRDFHAMFRVCKLPGDSWTRGVVKRTKDIETKLSRSVQAMKRYQTSMLLFLLVTAVAHVAAVP